MRVENSLSTPAPAQVEPAPVRGEGYSLESTLVPPQAPTFPLLSRFFNYLWSWVSPLFSLFRSNKKAKPPPAPDVLRAIHTAQVKKYAPYKMAFKTVKEHIVPTAFPGALAWYFNHLPSFVAQQGVKATTATIEYAARYLFPTLSSLRVKGTSLVAASAIAWVAAEKLGYPMGKLYLFFTVVSVISLRSQDIAQNQADQIRRFRMRMVG